MHNFKHFRNSLDNVGIPSLLVSILEGTDFLKRVKIHWNDGCFTFVWCLRGEQNQCSLQYVDVVVQN